MSRTIRRIAILAALMMLVPGVARGADVREYQLQYAPVSDTGGPLLIVTAVLDPSADLPATVSVPVPAGSVLLWAGEALGGDPSLDPARETTVERIGQMDVYTLTLEQAYVAQVEVVYGAPVVAGDRVSAGLTWTNPGPEALVSTAVVVEPGAGDVTVSPPLAAQTRQNDIGETLYPLGGLRISEGGSVVVDVSWRRGGGTGDGGWVLPLLIGALVIAALALIALVARERTRARRASGPDAT
jgi:hypothetical protein